MDLNHDSIATNTIYTLPNAYPGSNKVLQSTSAGVLSWVSNAGGGGTVRLNNNAENRLVTFGSTITELDGEANLTFDGTTLSNTEEN